MLFFHFNDAERKFIVVAAILIVVGVILDDALHRFPSLNSLITSIDQPRNFIKVDLNHASREELEALPYIGPSTADKILDYRYRWGGYKYVDELRRIPRLRMENFARFRDYLEVKP